MDTTLYIGQFTEKYKEMLNALHTILPENKSINEALEIHLDNEKVLQIMETYIQTMKSIYDKLIKKDESIFLKTKLTYFPDFSLQKIWNKKLKKNHKETMWSYLHVLYLTGTCATECGQKHNPLSFIKDNINESKLNDINEELKNLDETKLNEIMQFN